MHQKTNNFNSSGVYSDFYSSIINSGAVGFFSRSYHKQMERPFGGNLFFNRVLELASADGTHFNFVNHSFNEYFETDIRFEKLKKENITTLDFNEKIRSKRIRSYANAEDLSDFEDNYFDRVVATCLILHLHDIPRALSEWRRVTKDKGFITIYLHCEPGFFLRFAQMLGTKPKFKKNGIDYNYWQYSEHVTFFLRAVTLIKHHFESDHIKTRNFPFPFFGWNFNLWQIVQIQVTKDA
jgi:SAM-dependent methyltransferase